MRACVCVGGNSATTEDKEVQKTTDRSNPHQQPELREAAVTSRCDGAAGGDGRDRQPQSPQAEQASHARSACVSMGKNTHNSEKLA